jgi:hypothetical protein
MPYKDPEKKRECARLWARRHADDQKARYGANRDSILAQQKEYREKNIDSIREYDRMRGKTDARKAQGKAQYEKFRDKRIARACEYGKHQRRTNRAHVRNVILLRKYGITQKKWDAIFEKQGKVCAICGSSSKTWHTDHCHTTGKVRGILCFGCNVGLGNFRDDVTRLDAAIKYLNDSTRNS